MRIVQISPHFYPYVGGVERVVYELSKQFFSLGHDVTVLTTGKQNSEDVINGIKIVRFKELFKVYDIPVNFSLFVMLNKMSCDIIHAHFPPSFLTDFSGVIARIRRIPFVLTIHSIREHEESVFRDFLVKMYNNTFGSLTSMLTNRMILLSEEHLRNTCFKKYEKKIRIIPDGVCLKTNKIKKRNEFIVLCVSLLKRTHRFKGIDYLIKAIEHLDNKIRLVVIGEGELKKGYQHLAERIGVQERVTFTGYVSDEKLCSWYAKASCLCLPSTSRKEGFGLVALEGMSMRIPVIVTDVAGIASIVRESKCGLVIKPKSVEQIADAIKKLFRDKEMMAEMGRRAYKGAKKYNWERIAKMYLKVYEEAINDSEKR